jgi:hypothetical protein
MESSIEIRRKLKTVFSEQQADVLATVGEEVIRPVVDDLSELKAIVRDLAVSQKALAEAQQHTERRVGELAEAQQHTERRVGELAEAQQSRRCARRCGGGRGASERRARRGTAL